jgi:DNA-binding MarR family transcriptional regulator
MRACQPIFPFIIISQLASRPHDTILVSPCFLMKKKKIDATALKECLDCACLSFRQASRMVTQLFDEALVPVGLLSTQLPVLVLLAHYGPLTISRLAALLVMDRTTLTRILKPLQARGYIRTISTTDKRKNLLELAPKGYEILVEAYPLWQKAQAQIVHGLKPGEWKSVRQQLGEVVQIASRR